MSEPFKRNSGPFALPRGALGWLTGLLMDWINRPMQEAAVELLAVERGSRVLEIGFGTGALVQRLAALATSGQVAGVDLSELMVAQATRRNWQAVRAGRVDLRWGGVSELPFADQAFDRVVAINSFQFWPSPLDDLWEVRRVLAPGGRLVLGMRQTLAPHPRSLTPEQLLEVRCLLEQTGFRTVDQVERHHGRGTSVYLVAQ
jgi:ubiquinone/menaquinone biosynthesis C-methylase UbiE